MLTECNSCRATVDADVHGTYTEAADVGPFQFILAECPRCGRPFLLQREMYAPDQWSDPYRLYPPDEYQPGREVPGPIRGTFQEAITCYQAGAYTATTIVCGKTLEGLCESQGVEADRLVEGLEELYEQGVIEERLYEWADELRLARNEAVHDVEVSHSQQDATDVVEFTQAILEYVFTFRAKFAEFQQRRRGAERDSESR